MRLILLFILTIFFTSCITQVKTDPKESQTISTEEIKKNINTSLDNWHKAAAEANFDDYFNLMTKDGVFIGTDATENWQNKAFKTFSKPYFDKGKAWNFIALERNIYMHSDNKLAWFDELLDTQMKLCRGSGVIKLEGGNWKVVHYVLSIAIPNENVSAVIKLKVTSDSLYATKLLKKNKAFQIRN